MKNTFEQKPLIERNNHKGICHYIETFAPKYINKFIINNLQRKGDPKYFLFAGGRGQFDIYVLYQQKKINKTEFNKLFYERSKWIENLINEIKKENYTNEI